MSVAERKPIKGYEGLYEIDSLGRVFSVERIKMVFDHGRFYGKPVRERQLRLWIRKDGYTDAALCKNGKTRTYHVHRLVAEAFLPNPNNLPVVNHKDENPRNNAADNLEWCTHKYNSNYGSIKEKMSTAARKRSMTPEQRAMTSKRMKEFWKRRKTEKERDN